MRIRSIKPEFWRSEDIAALDRDTRLLFIGLWSYVDDNGVGRDVEALIVADLFALDEPIETLARVSRGLRELSERNLITRYCTAGRCYLHICNWKLHQKIDHPNKDRYPLPSAETVLATSSRESRDSFAPGTGEQRNRGAEEQGKKNSSAPATPKPVRAGEPESFAEFWGHYPRKLNRADAVKAYVKAIRRAPAADVIAGAARLAADPNLPEPTKIPHASRWLNGDRWNNPPYEPEGIGRASPPPARQSTAEQRAATGWNLVQQIRAEEEGDYLASVLEIGPA